jgi:hypothetical protein
VIVKLSEGDMCENSFDEKLRSRSLADVEIVDDKINYDLSAVVRIAYDELE